MGWKIGFFGERTNVRRFKYTFAYFAIYHWCCFRNHCKIYRWPELPVLFSCICWYNGTIWNMGLGSRADSYSFKKAFTCGNPFLHFFIGMLLAYYGYTVLFLHFYPKSQIVLWGVIAMGTPFCGFLIWHIHKNSHYANFIASLPFTIFFTEWYLTAFTVRDWAFSTARDELLFGIAYLCFTFSLLTVVPTNKKRLFSLLYGLLITIILIQLIQAENIVNPYEQLLNI